MHSKSACLDHPLVSERLQNSRIGVIDAAAEVCSIEPRSAAPPPVDPSRGYLGLPGKSSRTMATSEHEVRFERKQARQALTGSKMQGRLVRLVSRAQK